MAGLKKTIAGLLFFKEPEKKEKYVLKENKDEKRIIEKEKEKEKEKDNKPSDNKRTEKKQSKNEHEGNNKEIKKNEGAKRPLRKPLKIDLNSSINKEKSNNDNESKKESVGDTGGEKGEKEFDKGKDDKIKISSNMGTSLEYMKKVYSIPLNGDIIIREFDVVFKDASFSAFIIFYDGLTDRTVINSNILQPLMLLSNISIKNCEKDIGQYIRKHLLPQNQLKYTNVYEDVIDEVNFGGCGIFVDGLDHAFACDVKGWEHRGVEKPNNEIVIRGPQEAFNEVLRVNTALIRKILKDADLIAEDVALGRRSKTACSLMYIKDIANDSLVSEVRRRLKGIMLDYIFDVGQLEQMIEDSSLLPAPQMVETERPDRVASMLSEGKVAILMNGSPFALVLPTTLFALFHSAEDSYVRFIPSNFLRFIRIIGTIFAVLLPGIYIAITTFHQEMIPTDLLFAIGASRERVPFPTIVELLIMEIAFELIREAGVRIPGPIGPTLGIIGALILGQAAVAANIVSPILIIIVAVTGIGSFAIPNFTLAFSFRIIRFAYIFLGAIAGFLGITLGIFLNGLWLANAKSFGVPFLAPFAPKSTRAFNDTVVRAPMWKQERRPDFLNTKDENKQPQVSRSWTKNDKRNS